MRGTWLPQSTSSASTMLDRTGERGISGAIKHHVDPVFVVAFRQRRGERRGAGYRLDHEFDQSGNRVDGAAK